MCLLELVGEFAIAGGSLAVNVVGQRLSALDFLAPGVGLVEQLLLVLVLDGQHARLGATALP